MDLYDVQGHRLYLTESERAAFLAAAKNAVLPVRTFCLVLHYTGCRISEALALTPASFDFSGKTIVFETLKKRQRSAKDEKPLWHWSRTRGFSPKPPKICTSDQPVA